LPGVWVENHANSTEERKKERKSLRVFQI